MTAHQSFGLVFLVIISGCFFAGGCGSLYKPSIATSSELFEEAGKSAINSPEPSWRTKQTLRLTFLTESYQKNPESVILTLSRQKPSPDIRMAIAEISLLEAKKCNKSDPNRAVCHYLTAAWQSYEYLFCDPHALKSSPLTPSFRFMADIYNISVAELVSIRSRRPDPWYSMDFECDHTQYHFKVVRTGRGVWDPTVFDRIENSYQIKETGFENRYITRGLGAPLVGIADRPNQKPAFGRFFPKRLVAYPISAVLFFDPCRQGEPPSMDVRLVFCDPLIIDSVAIRDQTAPLEADFTTPLGLQLQNLNVTQFELRNLINSGEAVKNAGIYMLEPYRPEKIPVVMVHGLSASPEYWSGMFNDLRGDPELRKHYQFWFFAYPTGLPIGYSASLLRDQLDAVRAEYDPNGNNPNFNDMVLLGHSMGGLLVRQMVQDSGTTYWDYYFKKSFDEVSLDPNTRAFLKRMRCFRHLPYVKRVIFLATPHRGSPTADKWYARIGSGFIHLPTSVTESLGDVVSSKELKGSAAATWTRQTPDSLTLLSPSSSFIKLTNMVPLEPNIPYHSIIGTRKPVTSGTGTSDGLVPYESSHLDFAESELLVPYGHSVQIHPLAIAEVKRILYEHLKELCKNKEDK